MKRPIVVLSVLLIFISSSFIHPIKNENLFNIFTNVLLNQTDYDQEIFPKY